ncbi:hypothetical protein B0H21DRAFT_690852, partial [Amylocystis lapponica]
MISSALTVLVSAALALGSPVSFQLQNAIDAQKLNAQFTTLTASSSCSEGQQACVTSALAQCNNGTWALTSCSAATSCVALPLVNKPGTNITCGDVADAVSKIVAAGAQGG